MKRLFILPEERRLRSFWRILVQFITQTSSQVVIAIVLGIIAVLLNWTAASEGVLLLSQLGTFVSSTFLVFAGRLLLDRRSISSLGLRLNWQSLLDVLVGILVGGLGIGLMFALLWWAGRLQVLNLAWEATPLRQIVPSVSLMLGIFILVGWNEELLLRGYYLQNLAEGLMMPLAVLLSSLWFAASHLFNPGFGWQAFSGLTLAGLVLAFPYLRTRQLWLSIGLHIGWNFFESTVFGFAVSGINLFRLVEIRVSGPVLLTGGEFGPEAGLVLVPAALLMAGSIYLYTRGRGD